MASRTQARTLADVMPDADIFLGLSAGGVLKPEMVKGMADKPLILAMANPEPEIRPELAKEVRPDCVIATGRSDYPNQVNNVLCFPFIFRGALDVGATTINEEMKMAATLAIAAIAEAEPSDVVTSAYGTQEPFGPEYLIPRPFDPRLITTVAPAVAEAAMKTGVATRPITDMKAYRDQLGSFVYRSGTVMQPVFAAAAEMTKKVCYAEGEDDRVLRAAQVVVDENLARPILVGRTHVIEQKMRELGLHIQAGKDYEVADFDDDAMIGQAAETLLPASPPWRPRPQLRGRGDAPELDADRGGAGAAGQGGRAAVRHFRPLFRASWLCRRCHRPAGGHPEPRRHEPADAAGTYAVHLRHRDQSRSTAEQIAEITLLAAKEVRRFGLTPRAALLSHSNFGSADTPSAIKMRQALGLIQGMAPDLEVDGEMHADAALSKQRWTAVMPDSTLTDEANLLIMPNLDAANITFNALKAVAGQGITVGPILLGAAQPVHILTPTSTVRRIVNMTALTAVDAAVQSGDVPLANAAE